MVGALFVAGCTRVLDIDDTYVLGTAGSPPVGEGGATGGVGGFGAVPETGGLIGGGGTLSMGGTPSTGGAEPDGGVPCEPGIYTGTFDGSHTIVAPSTIDGTISFGLVGSGGQLSVEVGSLLAGNLTVLGNTIPAGTLEATTSAGQFDCSTRKLKGQLSGQIRLVGVVPIPITGTWEGTLDAKGAFAGTWTERASTAPSVPDAGAGGVSAVCSPSHTMPPEGTGCGTWSAR